MKVSTSTVRDNMSALSQSQQDVISSLFEFLSASFTNDCDDVFMFNRGVDSIMRALNADYREVHNAIKYRNW